MEISKNLKKYRKQKGLTQKQLASIVDLSFSMVSKLESGEQKNPSFDTINKLANALNVSPGDLLGTNNNDIYMGASESFTASSPAAASTYQADRSAALLQLLGYTIDQDDKFMHLTKGAHTWNIPRAEYDVLLPKLIDKISTDIESTLKLIETMLDFSTPIE